MTVRKIRKLGDPVLRTKSQRVEKIDEEILDLVEDMLDTVTDESSMGVGLAAPQVGVNKKIIVVMIDKEFKIFINPEYEIIDNNYEVEEEGCLSVYSIKYQVKRPNKIRINAMDIKGNEIVMECEGILSRIFQHEIDHLDGILFIDHLEKSAKRELIAKINDRRQ
jgi:peptide deformylase